MALDKGISPLLEKLNSYRKLSPEIAKTAEDIPVNDGRRSRLAGLMASKENDDDIYKAAKAMYEREIKFRAEWSIN